MTTEKAKGKVLSADLVKRILRAVRPDEREEVKYMLKCMNQLLRWQPSPETRESGRKLVAKTIRGPRRPMRYDRLHLHISKRGKER